MRDRKIIPASFYRSEMEKLGYAFPDDIEEQLRKESEQAFQDQIQNMFAAQQMSAQNKSSESESQDTANPSGNRSNNKSRPNESGGTEADN